MRIVPIPPNVLGVDTVANLAASECRALANLGYKFRGGYIDEMTPQEVQGQLGAGLPLLLYTYANEFDPEHTLDRLATLGILAGAHIVLDVEAVTIEAAQLIEKINAWGEGLLNHAYLPTIYFGSMSLLTSREMTELAVYRYELGASRLRDRHGDPAEPDRGFAIIQGRPVNFAIPEIPGKLFDAAFHRLDYKDNGFSAVVL
jgi:hypothetical protein